MEMSVSMASLLLRLSDQFNLKDFATMRMGALVALSVKSITPVVRFLTHQFHLSTLSLGQRIDILEVLTLAASELSGISEEKSFKKPQELKEELIQVSREIAPTESKVRKWGYLGKNVKKEKLSVNKFAQVAREFFFPLLPKSFYSSSSFRPLRENFAEQVVDILRLDVIVTTKLLFTLSFFIKCVGRTEHSVKKEMYKELISITMLLRYHKETILRRNCIYAFGSCLDLFSVDTLIEEFAEELQEVHEWFNSVIEEDPDNDCRNMAALYFNKVLELLKTRSNQLLYF